LLLNKHKNLIGCYSNKCIWLAIFKMNDIRR
jgi:hypothetical protein